MMRSGLVEKKREWGKVTGSTEINGLTEHVKIHPAEKWKLSFDRLLVRGKLFLFLSVSQWWSYFIFQYSSHHGDIGWGTQQV